MRGRRQAPIGHNIGMMQLTYLGYKVKKRAGLMMMMMIEIIKKMNQQKQGARPLYN